MIVMVVAPALSEADRRSLLELGLVDRPFDLVFDPRCPCLAAERRKRVHALQKAWREAYGGLDRLHLDSVSDSQLTVNRQDRESANRRVLDATGRFRRRAATRRLTRLAPCV